MQLLKSKKGQAMDALQAFILGVVGVAIVLVIGLIVLAELQGSTTTDSAAYNASGTVLTKLATVPTWIGIIIVVALAFIVLGFFYARGGGM